MKKIVLRSLGAILALVLCGLCIQAQKAATYAITNAKIVTVSGEIIARGTVLVRDGLIQAVGAAVPIPGDAQVIDANGLTVYPGFFDASSNVGIPAPQAAQGGGRQGGGGGGFQAAQAQQATATPSNSNYPVGLRPEVTAVEAFRPADTSVETARNNGFTTVLVVPRERVFNGQSALFNTAGDSVSEMVLRTPVAMHISFNTAGGGVYPTSLMGTFSAFRQMFLDAKRLQEWQKIYEKNPRGVKRLKWMLHWKL